MTNAYDLVILGGGAAAFAAATEADRRDRSAAIVNAGLPLGGTCVNVGCVPSKHLLAVAEVADEPSRFEAVEYDDPATDWATAVDGAGDLVDRLREENYIDVAAALDVDVYEGYGRFVDDGSPDDEPPTVEVVHGADATPGGETTDGADAGAPICGEATDGADVGAVLGEEATDGADAGAVLGEEATDGADAGAVLRGEAVLVATGSSPHIPAVEGIGAVDYETSETILRRHDLPDSVVLLGGGYVGMEWGQILHRMGADVTVLQRSGRVLSGMEGQLGRELRRCFEAEGIEVVTDVAVERVQPADGGVTVETSVAGDRRQFAATDLFVATGVDPNTDDLGLDAAGIETDATGAIAVDDHLRTANHAVYAAGDCVGNPMLETVAAKEGNHAVKNAFDGASATVDYDAVPAVVFTDPEVATVGTTERAYMAEHGTCACRTVDLSDLPKAQAVEDARGLLQVVKHHETDEIVGVHAVSPRAGDIVPAATMAVKFGLTVDDVVDTVFPFPTFSEAFKRACQAFRRDTSTMSCCVE